MEQYHVPARETRIEITVVNSRFVATLSPVFTVGEARAFVARIKAEFADASHNVPAYVVGHGRSVIAHCSDDGEPSGTAGRPALAVLQGSGLGDAAVVVTRYFGGTKLGTGGLVRAYGAAVREVLDHAERAVKVSTDVLSMTAPYGFFERLRRLVEAHRGQILDQEFAAEVTMMARVPCHCVLAFQSELGEMSNGRLQAEVVTQNEVSIVPLDQARGSSE